MCGCTPEKDDDDRKKVERTAKNENKYQQELSAEKMEFMQEFHIHRTTSSYLPLCPSRFLLHPSVLFVWVEINAYDASNVMFFFSLSLSLIILVVINFFSLPIDDECLSDDGRRIGMCMNVYECRIQGIIKRFPFLFCLSFILVFISCLGGTSRGDCALGFGSCCVCKSTRK